MPDNRPKVLLADDDNDALNLLIDVLHDDGYALLVASDAAQATQIALSQKPDLLLLDILMPGGGGYAVCEALRTRAPDHNWAVIFLTGLDGADQIRQGFDVGAVDYITKPFSPSLLRARVRTWLLRLGKHVPSGPTPPPASTGTP